MSRDLIFPAHFQLLSPEKKNRFLKATQKYNELKRMLANIEEKEMVLKHKISQINLISKKFEEQNMRDFEQNLQNKANTISTVKQCYTKKYQIIQQNTKILRQLQSKSSQIQNKIKELQKMIFLEKQQTENNKQIVAELISEQKTLENKIYSESQHLQPEETNLEQELRVKLQSSLTELETYQISQEELHNIYHLDFQKVNSGILEDIDLLQKNIASIKYQIYCLKDRYYKAFQELTDKQTIESNLKGQQIRFQNLQTSVRQLSNQNKYLSDNLGGVIERIIRERQNDLEQSNRSHINKYLKASKFLLQKLGFKLLSQQKGQSFVQKINTLSQEIGKNQV